MDCQIACVDGSDPDSKMSVERVGMVATRLANMKNSSVEEMTLEGTGWSRESSLSASLGQRSGEFLR